MAADYFGQPAVVLKTAVSDAAGLPVAFGLSTAPAVGYTLSGTCRSWRAKIPERQRQAFPNGSGCRDR
jgi:hypothetical protein